MITGVDVSRWQTTWAPAPADDFVVVKASGGSVKTGGWRQIDPLHDQHVAKARDAGLIVGHYAWMWPAPIAAQVDQFLAAAKWQPGDFLVCDWENPAPDLVPLEDMEAFTRLVMELAPEAKVLGYTFPCYGPLVQAQRPILWPNGGQWIADYRVGGPLSCQRTPLPFVPTLHQYTDKPIDQNRANFATVDDMRAWAEELIVATSQNGYTAHESRADIPSGVVTLVPKGGAKTRGVAVRKDIAPLFQALLDFLDAEVEEYDEYAAGDDWGHAYRPIRGNTTGLSNHASATAIDYNATQHPLGVSGTWTKTQVAKVDAFLRDRLKGCIRWGEHFGRPDGMHFEINKDLATCKRVIVSLTPPAPDAWEKATGADVWAVEISA